MVDYLRPIDFQTVNRGTLAATPAGGSLRARVVAGVDPASGGQVDQNQDLQPMHRASLRCGGEHTCRHPLHITSAYVFWHMTASVSHDFHQRSSRDRPTNRCAVPMPRSAAPFVSTSLRRPATLPPRKRSSVTRTIAMTMRYAHMITSHLNKAMSAFDAKPGTKAGTTGCPLNQSLETEREGFKPSVPARVQRSSRPPTVSRLHLP
jgi:hypothetical protein